MIVVYLISLRRLVSLEGRRWTAFKKEVWKYLMLDRELFRRGDKNIPAKRVVVKLADQ